MAVDVRAPLVTVTTGPDVVAGTVVLGTVTVRGLVNEAPDTVGRDTMIGMLNERLPLLLDKELRLEVELGEEVLEIMELELELGEEVLETMLLELELLDEEELIELELDEELLLELVDEILLLALELGKMASELVEGRLGTPMDEVMGVVPLPVHGPLQATIWPLTHWVPAAVGPKAIRPPWSHLKKVRPSDPQ